MSEEAGGVLEDACDKAHVTRGGIPVLGVLERLLIFLGDLCPVVARRRPSNSPRG